MKNIDKIIEALKIDDLKSLIDSLDNTINVEDANIRLSIHLRNDGEDKKKTSQVELIPEDGLTLLHAAAFYGALNCFVYLHTTKNANLRLPSSHSFIPLHYSCWSGSTEVSLYILTQDPSEASISVQGGTSIQLLYCAVQGGDPEVLQTLFDNGASLSHTFNDKKKLINKAIGLRNISLLRIIYDNSQNTKDSSLCAKAISDHNIEALKMLYNGKQDILFKKPDGSTDSLVRLICTVDRDRKYKSMLLQILEDAEDLDLEPPGLVGEGLVHFACEYGDLDVAKKLSNMNSFKVNRLDNLNRSGPYRFVFKRTKNSKEVVDILQLLIDKGFQIDGIGQNCPSLLDSFVGGIEKKYDAIECLLKNGASVDVKYSRDSTGKLTLYDYVMKCEDKKLKELFESYKKQPK